MDIVQKGNNCTVARSLQDRPASDEEFEVLWCDAEMDTDAPARTQRVRCYEGYYFEVKVKVKLSL
jgi:hypothetical protein